MKMSPETRTNYIRSMKIAIMSIEAIIDQYKKDQVNLQDANIRAFKEIRDICDRQIDMKSSGPSHAKK